MNKEKPAKFRIPNRRPLEEAHGHQSFFRVIPYLLGILFIAFLAFSPALKNQFVRWDDYPYIVDDPLIRDLALPNILHIFSPSTVVLDNYHPLTILSYAIEYHFVGNAPTLYHLDNVLLHLLNVTVVACLAWLLVPRVIVTVVVAALFALHPLRVESVVWAAERKDLLYTFFFFLTLVAYARYAADPRPRWFYYAAALACFLLSSLAKAQAVVLTLTLFLLDYWFSRRPNARLILEKLPFLALSLALGLLATLTQAEWLTPARLTMYSVPDRLAIVSYNLVAYLCKLLAPYRLACYYGYPATIRSILWAIPVLLCLAALFVAFGRRHRVAVLGVLFFLFTIAIVVQLLPVGDAIIADRYTYVPFFGLFLLIGYLVDRAMSRPRWRLLVGSLAALQLAAFALKTCLQAGTWRDTETLWRQELRVNPNEPRAHHNLGVIHASRGEPEVAIRHLELCVANGQGYDRLGEAYSNLGAAYAQAGLNSRAIAALDTAVQIEPRSAQAWLNRGLIHAKAGSYEAALADYDRAIALTPGKADVLYSRANAARKLGRMDDAISDYSKAIAADPLHAGAHANRGNCYADQGKIALAIEDYDAALRLHPDDAATALNRSRAYLSLGRAVEALADYDRAARAGLRDEGYRAALQKAIAGEQSR